MRYYVYLIKSIKDNNFYIGQTNNLRKRIKEHNEGKVKSTKNRIPLKLVGYKTFKDRNRARWEEYRLKKSAHLRKKIYKIINIQGT